MLSRLRTVLHHLNRDKATTVSGSSSLLRATSATMSSDAPSQACCTIPPVVSDTDSYKPKGSYVSFEHADKEKFAKDPITRAYVTGPTDTGKTIIVIFDIFGYYNQTIQGADILAETVKAKVIMPDFFRNKPMDLNLYPPTTDEAKKTIGEFFKVQGNFEDRGAELLDVAQAERNKGATKVGVIGYCWGAKVATSGNIEGAFDASAGVHPAFWARGDGEKIQAPIAVFPSKNEDKEEFDKFMEAANKKPFASKNKFKRYDTQIHGWAAARADLSDPENLKQYEDVYTELSHFFKNALA